MKFIKKNKYYTGLRNEQHRCISISVHADIT